MDFLTAVSDTVWGMPTVALILGVGAWLSVKLGFIQIRRLKEILKSGGKSIFTALAATVGTGSVVGVATAITAGGPGAVLWLWVSAFFGMAVAYGEGVLSIKYRRENPRKGGIWYALASLGSGGAAKIYALFCVLASFGMGCAVQTGSASSALFSEFKIPPVATGIFCAVLLLLCLFKKNFAGSICGALVPVLAGLYIVGATAVIIKNIHTIPAVFKDIFRSAFGLRPILGGVAGYSVKTAISIGCRRGIFSNEAGLGTTAPVHAASDIDDPDRQGLMNMLEVIIDTFVICTLTALAILSTGAHKSGADGAVIVAEAARSVFGERAAGLVAVCIAAFAIATAIGWSQIGLSAAEYLTNGTAVWYKLIFPLCALIGAVTALEAAFKISDIFNGLMVVPCLCAIILLRNDILPESKLSPRNKESARQKNVPSLDD